MTTLDDVNGTDVCYMLRWGQSLDLTNNGDLGPSISCLTSGQCIGLAIIVEASFVSFISVVVIFIWIYRNVRWYRRKFPTADWKLFQKPTDIYMFSLFLFDIVQAIGGFLDIRWAHRGIVTTGNYCTAQGIIQEISQVGIALIIILLAVHTFVVTLWQVRLQAARGVAFGMVSLVCVFLTLWVAIAVGRHKDYEKLSPYWCRVSPRLPGIGLGIEYIWLWIALFASAMLYIPLYLWAEGHFSVDEVTWYRFHMRRPDRRVAHAQRRAALGMLLYAVATSIVLLCLFIPRWLLASHHNVSSAAMFFSDTMVNLSGVIDVLLFLIVRPHLLLFPRPANLDELNILLAQGI